MRDAQFTSQHASRRPSGIFTTLLKLFSQPAQQRGIHTARSGGVEFSVQLLLHSHNKLSVLQSTHGADNVRTTCEANTTYHTLRQRFKD